MRKTQNKSRPRKPKATTGRNDEVAGTARKDYYVANNLELTPHPNQKLVATLGRPIMDRRFKYSTYESSLLGGSATSQTPLSLVTINQGTTDITRTGDRVRARRLRFCGRLTGGASAVGATGTRVLVVLWNPVGSAAVNSPVAGQVAQGAAPYLPYAAYSRDFGDSYQVVHDSLHSVQLPSTTGEIEFVWSDRSMVVDMEFAAGGATPITNNLYVFVLTDSTAAAAFQPTLFFQSTLWYEDLDA